MSKGLSYNYSGTKGHIVSVASSLPKTYKSLLGSGWTDRGWSAALRDPDNGARSGTRKDTRPHAADAADRADRRTDRSDSQSV